jgi:glycosyltransferase involved in cell wall biosynthesis
MKVMHVPFCFHPDPVGGTEVYVASLAWHLQKKDVQVVVAAPGERESVYMHEVLSVRRFAVARTVTDLRDLYGEGDAQASHAFGRILDYERPDVVHLHAFTRGVSVRLLGEAKRRGIPTIFTYHTPTVSCQRGTLMRWGTEVCDGRLDVSTCARCTLHSLGLSKVSSTVVGSLPMTIGRLLGAARLSGGCWTALRMTELVQLRQSAFRALLDEVDHVIALCQWAKDLLLRNGIPEAKITVSHHGLPQRLANCDRNTEVSPLTHGPLRIAYLGRLDPIKGPDLLIRALRLLPEVPVELHLCGVVQGAAGAAYLQQLKALAIGDARIAFLPAVSSDRIVSLLRDYHLLAVPSRGLETGPLVVLEAFAAGIPVMGSNLGGIAELVEHDVNGLLVAPDSQEAWGQGLKKLCEDRNRLIRLRAGIRPPRSMSVVAEEMLVLYRTLLHAKATKAGSYGSRVGYHAHP